MTTPVTQFLAEYPSTNARLFASLCLCVIYVIVVLVGMILNRHIDNNVVWSIGTFLLVLSGIDTTQFGIKRKTTILTPPEVTAENSGGGSA